MEFVKNIATDSDTIEILLDYIPDRVFIYNKTTKTFYEKINDTLVTLGSEESYRKGKNSLHYEGEVAKVSNLDSNASEGSVYLISNDTTTYKDRVVNSLFIKQPDGSWKEVRLNVYSTMEVDKIVQDEADARESADATLQDNIDAEESARKYADSTLQNNIDSETHARENADSTLQDNIDAEESSRKSADETLQGNIEDETSARQDADGTLQNNIDSEASAREEADTTLQNNIDDETSARENADKAINQSITEINELLENINFDDNIVIQYNSDLTAPPADFSEYVVGTAWKITQDFTMNGVEVPKNTFIFKKDENTLDILGGGQSKVAVFDSERVIVRSTDDTVWVTNYYMGSTSDKGRYIIFNNYSPDSQTYSFGHFLIKGKQNVFNYDVLLNQVSGNLNNYWTQGNGAPVEVFSCDFGNKKYVSLFIDSSEDFEVFYTGWVSSDFETFEYTQSQLSNFSAVALGEFDLSNLPKGSEVSWEPIWRYSENSRQSITEYWDNWDWDNYPIAYVRPVINTNGNVRSLDCRYVFGTEGDSWYQDNLNALKHILGDETKPTYLVLDNMKNLNSLSVERIGVFFGGVSNEFPGLKGLVMPQDENSSYCGADWWGSDTNRLFLVNFQNLEYLKLNPYTQTLGNFCLRDLPSLKSIRMPDALTSLDFNTDRPLTNCDNLTTIILPSETTVVQFSGTYGDVISDFFWRDGSQILVKKSLLKDYKTKYYLDGFVLALIRGF